VFNMVLGCVEWLREGDYLCQVSKEASKQRPEQRPLWLRSTPENTTLNNVTPWSIMHNLLTKKISVKSTPTLWQWRLWYGIFRLNLSYNRGISCVHVLGPHTKDLPWDWEYMMDLSIGRLYLTQENCFKPWVQNRCCSFVVFGFGWSWRV
jgi:hypothetical protein